MTRQTHEEISSPVKKNGEVIFYMCRSGDGAGECSPHSPSNLPSAIHHRCGKKSNKERNTLFYFRVYVYLVGDTICFHYPTTTSTKKDMAHLSDGKLSCQLEMSFWDAGSEVMESNFCQRLLSKQDN